MKNNKKKGFTLVELLVVIAILAILATVSVVGYTSFIESAHVSNDNSLAAQLTHALDAYKVNGTVTNANELKAAIEDFMGADYLKDMSPESAQHGYHFWYDIEAGEVVVKRPKDLDFDGLIRPLFTTLIGAEGEEDDYSYFASGSFRIFGKYYLLDGANEYSAIVNAIKTLEKSDMTADEYASILAGSNVNTKEQGLQEELKNNLSSVAIHNENGIFTNNTVEEANANVNNVYYPEGVTKLAENTNEYKFDNVESAEVPFVDTTTGTLNYFNEDTAINMNVDSNTAEDIAQDLAEKFQSSDVNTNSLTITITTTDGTKYEFKVEGENHVIVDIETNGENVKVQVEITPVYSTHLVDYTIYVENHDGKYDVAWDAFKTTDKTIQMATKDFTSDNESDSTYVPDKSVTWSLIGAPADVSIDAKGLITGITGPCTFTVQAISAMVNAASNPVTKTYEIRIGEIVGFKEFKHPDGSNVAFDTNTWVAEIDHQIVSSNNNSFTFTVTPHYSPEDVTSCDDTILCDITDGATYTVNNENNTITVEFTKAGTYTLEVSYKEYPEVKRYIEFNVTNIVTSFEIGFTDGANKVTGLIYKDFYVVNNTTFNMDVFGTTSDGLNEIADSRITWSIVGPGNPTIGTDGKFTVTAAGTYTVSAIVDGDTSNEQSFKLIVSKPEYPVISFNGNETPVMEEGGIWVADEEFQMGANNKVELFASVKYGDGVNLQAITPIIRVKSGDATYENGYLTINKAGDIVIEITAEGYPELTTVFTITAVNKVSGLNLTVNQIDNKVVLVGETIFLAPDYTGNFTITPNFTWQFGGATFEPVVEWRIAQPEGKNYVEGANGTFKLGADAASATGTETIVIKATVEGITKTYNVVINKLESFKLSFTGVETESGKGSTYLSETAEGTTIYAYYNYEGKIVINPTGFDYVGNDSFTSAVTYAITAGDAVELNGNELTVNANATTETATVKVTAACDANVFVEVTVKLVKPISISFKFNGAEEKIFPGKDGNFSTTIAFNGKSSPLYAFENIAYNFNINDILKPYAPEFTYNLNSTELFDIKKAGSVTGLTTDTMEITKKAGTSTFTISINDSSYVDQTFTVECIVNLYTPYTQQFTNLPQMAIGNSAATIPLSVLFSRGEGTITAGTPIEVVLEYGITAESSKTVPLTSFAYGDDWGTKTIDTPFKDGETAVATGQNVKIHIGYTVDGVFYKNTLDVKYVAGTNVIATASDTDGAWANVTSTNKALVLLSDISTSTSISVKSGKIYGNNFKVTSSYKAASGTSAGFIKLETGEIENLIVVGGIWSDLYTNAFSGNTYGIRADSGTNNKITNSYVFGFHAPIAISSGTLTIDNSVIEGGTLANIFCYPSATGNLTMIDSKTIQNREGYKATDGNIIYGMGIYLDSAAKTQFTMKGNTHQYNFISEADNNFQTSTGLGSVIKSTISSMFSGDYTSQVGDGRHSYNNVTFMNMGVIHDHTSWRDSSFPFTKHSCACSNSISVTATTEGGYTNSLKYTDRKTLSGVGGFLGFGAKDYHVWSYSKANSGCTGDNFKGHGAEELFPYYDYVKTHYTLADGEIAGGAVPNTTTYLDAYLDSIAKK